MHKRVTISLKDVPIQKVFQEIILQTGVSIVYNDAYFKDIKPVSITAKDVSLEEFLTKLFSDQPLVYEIRGKSVSVRRKYDAIANRNTLKPNPPITVKGRVVDEEGKPVEGA